MNDVRPTTVLIAALGGEGGGVLADWVVNAARAEDLWVQATSIPGVAQRTGATTYYIEMMPKSGDGRRPVFALTASPGNIDLMVASELLEAGRAVENGYITPDRTTLIASTHRFYAMAEKTATTDGRYDADRIEAAAAEMAKQAILRDLKAKAEDAGSIINAVLLGAMAGSGALPVPADTLRQAIVDGGIAVEFEPERVRGRLRPGADGRR
ncbi:MAG: 2-oxoacid:acceptor oxidoreductase family protein [Minwuia sp.]|uniref:2-oxoacid:acceptor oxidoreductase family protein n=1 Tax=Minwuia sp. TaxID=2493630 RepID=UPI003A8B8818